MNSTVTSNFSQVHSEEEIFGFYVPLDVPLIVLAVIVIIINCFVIFLLFTRRYLQTPENTFLGSLALSDLITGALVIPLFIACSATLNTPLCLTTSVLERFVSILTILELLSIIIDRYLAIVKSINFQGFMTLRRALLNISAIWFLSFVTSIIQLSWFLVSDYKVTEYGEEEITFIEGMYDIVTFVLFFGIPLTIMSYCLFKIFTAMHRQNNKIRRQNYPSRESRASQKRVSRQMKGTVVLATMLSYFVFCWSSSFMIRIQHTFGNTFFELSVLVETVLIFIRFSTSAFNPALYTLKNKDFKKATKSVMKKIFE